MNIPLKWAPGDRCSYDGNVGRVICLKHDMAHVAIDGCEGTWIIPTRELDLAIEASPGSSDASVEHPSDSGRQK